MAVSESTFESPPVPVGAPARTDPDRPAVLVARGLRHTYPGTRALDWAPDDELVVRAGTVHGLLGENGAGKSTVFGALVGAVRPDAGEMTVGGRPHRPRTVVEARVAGVELILQEPALLPSLTVAESFMLGAPKGRRDAAAGVVLPGRAVRRARAALASVAPHVDPTGRVGSLNLEDQKLVELARAVARRPVLLLVDELSACLGRRGLSTLHRILAEQAARGTAVLYISHYLEEIATVCDTVTVLKDGRLVATLPADTGEEELTRLMVGRPQSSLYPARRADAPSTPTLDIVGAGVAGAFQDVTLDLRAGEILGIAGLVGCGSEELGRAIFGNVPLSAGDMRLHGAPYRPHGPRTAIAAGVAYVPPDRDSEGLLLEATIADNLVLPNLPNLARSGVYIALSGRSRIQALAERAGVKCRSIRQPPLGLSGGNRQKVVLAKWLLRSPQVLILHNPTRGIDVGAKADFYARVRALASAGTAVLLISDELPELLGMSDRLVVMRRGRVSGRFTDPSSVAEEVILTHMI